MLLIKTCMIKNYSKLFTILISIALLTGCGFTTYSAKSLPPQLQQVYLQAEHPYGQFEVGFKKKLKKCGVTLLEAPQAASIIHLTSNYSCSNSNPDSSTQGRIYSLTYTASFSVSDHNQQQLLPTKTVSVSRNITLQPNEVFETTPQADIVKQEMSQELSIKILNILSARKTFQTLGG